MPTTVTANDGTAYHLWQLPALSSPQPTSTVTITTLDNELSDGFRSSVRFGSDTGTREWKLKLPTLAGIDVNMPTVTDINGATVSREQYLYSLFMEQKITGTPFAYQDPRTNQYYLVDFAEKDLSYEQFKYVAAYGTGITLRQRRLPNITVFNVADMFNGSQPITWMKDYLTLDQSGNGNPLTASGDVTDSLENNIETWSLNTTLTTGKLAQTASITLYDAFLVMKCRTATFGRTSGILTGSAGTRALIGTNGAATFTNLSLTNFEYRFNGVLKAQSAMTAPMQDYGIVHLRWSSPFTVTNPQIGQDRGVASTHASIDLGEIIFFTRSLPMHLVRELLEYLQVKWAIS